MDIVAVRAGGGIYSVADSNPSSRRLLELATPGIVGKSFVEFFSLEPATAHRAKVFIASGENRKEESSW